MVAMEAKLTMIESYLPIAMARIPPLSGMMTRS
jgi:hypothetical protein